MGAMKQRRKNASFLWRRDPSFVLFGLAGTQTSWRGLSLVALVFLGSLVLAAPLLPFAYRALEFWDAEYNSQPARLLLSRGANNIFDLLRWVPILVGLPWVMRACQVWSLSALGLGRSGFVHHRWVPGFAAGVVLVAVLAAGQLSFGTTAIAPRESLSFLHILKWISISLALGVVVAIIEEAVFRGFILRGFYSATRYPWFALALSAAFFAYTHFKIPMGEWTKVGPVQWQTGWLDAYWMLVGIAVEFEFRRFLALWLLGMLLGALTLRARALWPAVGLHGGLVFGMLMYHDLARSLGPPNSFWGTTALIDGWATPATLGLLLLGVILKTPRRTVNSFVIREHLETRAKANVMNTVL
jgi:membrane protease YdiL (CAAX protease family)